MKWGEDSFTPGDKRFWIALCLLLAILLTMAVLTFANHGGPHPFTCVMKVGSETVNGQCETKNADGTIVCFTVVRRDTTVRVTGVTNHPNDPRLDPIVAKALNRSVNTITTVPPAGQIECGVK